MKYIKEFKLFETGEWSKNVDWQFVKDNPDDDSDESSMIKSMEEKLNTIISELDNEDIFTINDIRGLDLYQGAYANVTIFGKHYKIHEINEDAPDSDLWIQNFPIDNTSQDDRLPGYKGSEYDIADLLNDINDAGGIELYNTTKKYNL